MLKDNQGRCSASKAGGGGGGGGCSIGECQNCERYIVKFQKQGGGVMRPSSLHS